MIFYDSCRIRTCECVRTMVFKTIPIATMGNCHVLCARTRTSNNPTHKLEGALPIKLSRDNDPSLDTYYICIVFKLFFVKYILSKNTLIINKFVSSNFFQNHSFRRLCSFQHFFLFMNIIMTTLTQVQ